MSKSIISQGHAGNGSYANVLLVLWKRILLRWLQLAMGIRISPELYKAVACVRPQSCRSSRSEDRALNPITTFLGRNKRERGRGHRPSPVATDAEI